MIPSQYYFTVRPFLASCEQTVRGATRESLVRFSLGLFAHLVIDLRRASIILLPLLAVTPIGFIHGGAACCMRIQSSMSLSYEQ